MDVKDCTDVTNLSVDDILTLSNGLHLLKRVQEKVSGMVEGAVPEKGKEPTTDQVRTYTLALVKEVLELMDELNWKPWKDKKDVIKERTSDEFADVLAFLGLLIIYMDAYGITPYNLAEAYAKKTKVNVSRLNGEVEGYKSNGRKG